MQDERLKAERRAGRPTSEQTSQLNEDILQAAFHVFCQDGFGGASIEKIAQKSRTTRRSVLNRFQNKESLLVSVIEMRIRLFSNSIQPTEATFAMKPMDALKETCRTILKGAVAQESINMYLLTLGHVAKFPDITRAALRENDRWANDLATLVSRAQRTGAFKGRNPDVVATNLIGSFISNPINRCALGDPQFRDSVMLEHYFESMWSFVEDAV